MKIKLAIANIVTALAFSATLLSAQMQMPNEGSGVSKPTGSSTQKTLTGTVSDSMCGARHMAKDCERGGLHPRLR